MRISSGVVRPVKKSELEEANEAIRKMQSVLKLVANTLPHIGGNDRSVQSLLREIKAVM
jgi:hypothetical protein